MTNLCLCVSPSLLVNFDNQEPGEFGIPVITYKTVNLVGR